MTEEIIPDLCRLFEYAKDSRENSPRGDMVSVPIIPPVVSVYRFLSISTNKRFSTSAVASHPHNNAIQPSKLTLQQQDRRPTSSHFQNTDINTISINATMSYVTPPELGFKIPGFVGAPAPKLPNTSVWLWFCCYVGILLAIGHSGAWAV